MRLKEHAAFSAGHRAGSYDLKQQPVHPAQALDLWGRDLLSRQIRGAAFSINPQTASDFAI